MANSSVQSVLNRPKELSMTQILETHAHADIKFDVRPVFTVVKKILNRASDVVHHVVVGNKLENMEEEPPTASLGISLCTLKHLYCEMACKLPGEESNTGKKILEKLTKYSWDAKAVLTLAAFALDYGDFWLLAHLHASDKSAKWAGILKGVPTIVTDTWLQKHKVAIIQLDQLIKSTLEAIDCILVLEGLSDRYAEEDLQELSEAMYHIPLDVYYAIITVVACTTQMCCLINDEGKPEELSLSFFNLKITATVNSLNLVIQRTKGIIAKLEDYRKLVKIMNNPGKITVVFNEMRFTSLLRVDVLKEIETKNVFLFFSGLDICENEISIFKSIDDNESTKDQYRIIWIPIVEDWTVDMARTKYKEIQSKMPSTWYMLQNFSFDLGIQYIKEKWQFKNRPVVVVMNSQGKVVHRDAYYMIALGINPLLSIAESPLANGEDSVGQILIDSLHKTSDRECHFFYGSKDTAWINEFEQEVNALGTVYKSATFKLSHMEDEGENTLLWKFWNHCEGFFLGWNSVKSFLLSETDKKTESSTVISTILNLLSFKTAKSTEWVVLFQGSKLVDSGDGKTILQVLKEFERSGTTALDFTNSFLNCHKNIKESRSEKPPCCHIDLAEDPGKITEVMCPVCTTRMKLSYSRFTCCHPGYLPSTSGQH